MAPLASALPASCSSSPGFVSTSAAAAGTAETGGVVFAFFLGGSVAPVASALLASCSSAPRSEPASAAAGGSAVAAAVGFAFFWAAS